MGQQDWQRRRVRELHSSICPGQRWGHVTKHKRRLLRWHRLASLSSDFRVLPGSSLRLRLQWNIDYRWHSFSISIMECLLLFARLWISKIIITRESGGRCLTVFRPHMFHVDALYHCVHSEEYSLSNMLSRPAEASLAGAEQCHWFKIVSWLSWRHSFEVLVQRNDRCLLHSLPKTGAILYLVAIVPLAVYSLHIGFRLTNQAWCQSKSTEELLCLLQVSHVVQTRACATAGTSFA